MKHLLAATLFLFPLSLFAEEPLAGKWRIDPGKMEEFNKTVEPMVARTVAVDKLKDPAEIRKIREKYTALLMNQRITFTQAADGSWEQQIDYDDETQKSPVTVVKQGSNAYQIYQRGNFTMTVHFEPDHVRFVSVNHPTSFTMIRDTAAAAKPVETPEP